ncbi:4Fe-4S dicluster domain-containing protein [Cohnella thailandensis]|uniref:Ferredoxin family protein n=1 Tax=Cohnella thailandensis TaxID=557557 RepID=A0A841SZM1_9BACL|nr:ferredoxin family protein [Cohnella thailandensis]MBB6636076.1 ferredoxin family protein [Cohnella thailandensis]MBP1973955.1 NAD-dependent dihydropyrimidine dehydrogenase PreA subunit [Cohnella thailandensis]
MIQLVSRERCVSCSRCIQVCPTRVFDESPEGLPVIARQEDCQTCFMCELYCPVDALYVSPHDHPVETPGERELAQAGLLGSYREHVGWGRGRSPGAAKDASYLMIMEMRRTSGN